MQHSQRVPSLCDVLDPEILANPYPLYRALREHDPVAWDPYLHAWVVTSYDETVRVLHSFSASRAPTPEQLHALQLGELAPIAAVMVRQMLFMDAPAHTRLRGLCSAAFTPRRVEELAGEIRGIADDLIDGLPDEGPFDLIARVAAPLPAIVTAHLLGVPRADYLQLKSWSADFAEVLGNFQHNPDHAPRILRSLAEMTGYFRAAIRDGSAQSRKGLIGALLNAEQGGARLTEDEVIANLIVTMVGGQETTTNLIGNGMLTLLLHPQDMAAMRSQPEIIGSAIEELLRYESPSQHTARLVPHDLVLGGKTLARGDAVIAVMAAANRDPKRFPDPDKLDLVRPDNRHLAFGWAAHFCFGAPLARLEGRIVFTSLLRRLPDLALVTDQPQWRENMGLRGLSALALSSEVASPAFRRSAALAH